jgi:hypothetical protein
LTGFSETSLFSHFRRKSRPRNTLVPLNTRSIAPNQPQRDEDSAGRRLNVLIRSNPETLSASDHAGVTCLTSSDQRLLEDGVR